MDKDKIIALIEKELVQADEAQNDQEFEKHIYAIHTLTSIYDSSSSTRQVNKQTPTMKTSSSTSQVSAAEIKAMGGKVPQHFNEQKETTNSTSSSNIMVTDDHIGNGDSIFDF